MTWERVKLYHWFTPYRNIYSEWNKDLNIRHEITIVVDKNSQYALCNIFLDMSPQERETKTKIN